MMRDEHQIDDAWDGASAGDAEVARVLDDYLVALEAGESVDPGRLLAEHPAIAPQLRACLDVMQAAARAVDDPVPPSVGGSAASALPPASGLRSTWDAGDGPPPRIHLHDPDDDEPMVRPRSPAMPRATGGTWGRFQLLGEIARGGMGAVLKGRDPDLGRDLAIKVLLESHRGDPQVVRRFIEEAQIGGQLQHPGIVPVYELGTSTDRRPYFAMKLVKGWTLASMLQGRAAPSVSHDSDGRGSADAGLGPTGDLPIFDDVPRLLPIFEQVCQTMAYAHARGVIHRDLKPSNIMVGSFGEVQVMDWGLAKVLPRGGVADEVAAGSERPGEAAIQTVRTGPADGGGESQSGSVLGTPAYMAPEQARGEVERLDERADVFGLGAILCEVLTGRPPFVGTTREEVRTLAARGDLADAMGRLVGCGADAELVALARDCLAAEPERRPCDAGEVARRISAHEVGVRERLKAAGLARAEALARAEEAQARAVVERSRRRRTMALAAAMLGLFGLGGGGWVHLERQRLDRAARVDRATSGVESLYAEAKQAGDDVSRWIAAREAARALESLLADAPDAATRDRVAAFAREVTRGASSAEADQRLLAELAEIRGARVNDRDGMQSDARYADAFREAGMDLDTSPPDRAAAVIAARPRAVRMAIAAALDDWAALRRLEAPDHPDARRLTETARKVDPDPWRDRLRAALQIPSRSERLASLRELAKSARADEWPAESLVLLGGTLTDLGDGASAETILRRAVGRHPGDVWINIKLAGCLQRLSRREESIRYLTAARALRPDLAHILGHHLYDKGETDEAIAVFEDLARLRPEDELTLICWGGLLEERHKAREARDAFDRAMAIARTKSERQPENARTHFNLGYALALRGQRDEAIAEYRTALRLRPDFPAAHCNLANTLLLQGKMDASIPEFQAALRLRPDDPNFHEDFGTALWIQGKVSGAIAEFREALRLWPDYAVAHVSLGSILCDENHDYKAAEAEFREALRLKPDFARAHCNLGIVLERQNRRDESMAAYGTALRLDPGDRKAQKGLGALEYRKKVDEAIAGYRAALRLKPDDSHAHFHLGLALNQRGQQDEAIAEFREVLRLRPDNFDAHFSLGNTLASQGRLDEAIADFRAAVRRKPEFAGAHLNLGSNLQKQGKWEEAMAEYREALRLEPDYAEAHCNVGHVLCYQGRFAEALVEMKRGHELGSKKSGWNYPSAQWVREIEQMAGVEAKLPAILAGKARPAKAAESIMAARICANRKLYGASAGLWSEAFRSEPKLADDVRSWLRYTAAHTAALAGCAPGRDDPPLDDAARARWRKQAMDWLEADLEAWSKRLDADTLRASPVVTQSLRKWKADDDLAGLRDASAVSKLPEDEQKSCRSLWAEVDALLTKARGATEQPALNPAP